MKVTSILFTAIVAVASINALAVPTEAVSNVVKVPDDQILEFEKAKRDASPDPAPKPEASESTLIHFFISEAILIPSSQTLRPSSFAGSLARCAGRTNLTPRLSRNHF